MNSRSLDRKYLFKVSKIVFRCVARNRGEDINNLSVNTSLNNDLGLDGDDVDELFDDITKYIREDLADFDYYKYFNDEGSFALSFNFLFAILLLPLKIIMSVIHFLLSILGTNIGFSRRLPIRFGMKKSDFKLSELIRLTYAKEWNDFDILLAEIESDLKAWQYKFQDRFNQRYKS
ncbi:hypothetical protein ACQV5M_17370 [Leptospira sp. SA-E8]|uniref:hypothetical protein n=1 Tax=Leptospira sp. SA-E8 TaxID=3422259 RepID=UPI003EBD8933